MHLLPLYRPDISRYLKCRKSRDLVTVRAADVISRLMGPLIAAPSSSRVCLPIRSARESRLSLGLSIKMIYQIQKKKENIYIGYVFINLHNLRAVEKFLKNIRRNKGDRPQCWVWIN